jgi:type IV pilus assembly protein PilW
MSARYRHREAPRRCPRQRGVTLIELLVSMAIAVFLLGGLFTIVQRNRTVFGNQVQMSQLQDNERLAMTLVGDVVQQAGYYPDPTVYTVTGSFPVYTSPGTPPVPVSFATAGQSIVGRAVTAGTSTAAGDAISVRFTTALNDGMINCTGGSNGTAPTLTYVSTFYVDNNGNLACELDDGTTVTPQPLVSGLQSMSVLYGVKTDFTLNNGAIDSYLKASEMSATNWLNVIAVRVTLNFVNPLASQPNQPATIPVQRVIAVMNHTGVTS